MRTILRYVYRKLLPATVGQSLDVYKNLRGPFKEGLQEKRVLVLSPHPDDDIVGCGGSLHILHQRGAEITVAYMTDGRKGNPEYSEDDLVFRRKEEAKKAADIIGVDRLIFLSNRDSELSSHAKSVEELFKVIREVRPEAVFLPFMLDNHPDHVATNELFVRASKDYTASMTCYAYEIWTPLPVPNCIIDITDQAEVKRKAIGQHCSQIARLDFTDSIMGLSKYRSVLHNAREGYAEAFIHCDAKEYRRLWQVAH